MNASPKHPSSEASGLPGPLRDQRQEIPLTHHSHAAHPAFQFTGQIGDVARLLSAVGGEHEETLTAFRLAGRPEKASAQKARTRMVSNT